MIKKIRIEFKNGLVVEREVLDGVDIQQVIDKLIKSYQFYDGPKKAEVEAVFIDDIKQKQKGE